MFDWLVCLKDSVSGFLKLFPLCIPLILPSASGRHHNRDSALNTLWLTEIVTRASTRLSQAREEESDKKKDGKIRECKTGWFTKSAGNQNYCLLFLNSLMLFLVYSVRQSMVCSSGRSRSCRTEQHCSQVDDSSHCRNMCNTPTVPSQCCQ